LAVAQNVSRRTGCAVKNFGSHDHTAVAQRVIAAHSAVASGPGAREPDFITRFPGSSNYFGTAHSFCAGGNAARSFNRDVVWAPRIPVRQRTAIDHAFPAHI